MSSIIVNGRNYQGRNVTIINDKVIIDGKEVDSESESTKQINISIEGNIESLSVDKAEKVSVSGEVNELRTLSGDVEVSGNVTGNVKTMSGNVKCGNVSGKIKTMSGNVRTN